MRFSSPTTTRGAKLMLGFGLVAVLWVILALVAFVPFDRDAGGAQIIPVTAAAYALVIYLLARRRWLDVETVLYAVLAVAVLIALFMVPLRQSLPDPAVELNREVSAQHTDRHAYAEALFWQLAPMFTSPTREYLLQPLRIFVVKSPAYYWETRGYMPSHLQAQLYRILLLESGRFAAGEVEYRLGRCAYSPHGYVVIRSEPAPLYADLWAAGHFADYRFGQVADMPACDDVAAAP